MVHIELPVALTAPAIGPVASIRNESSGLSSKRASIPLAASTAATLAEDLATPLALVVNLALVGALWWSSQRAPETGNGKVELKPAAKEKMRTAYIDNAKFLLLVLVLQSHLLDGNAFSSLYRAPSAWPRAVEELTQPNLSYNLFSLTAMQAFAFLSGVVSQGELTSTRSMRLLVYVAAPIVLQMLLVWGCNPMQPGGHMWYLHALLLWRLGIQIFRALPPWIIAASGALVSASAPYGFSTHGNHSLFSPTAMGAQNFALPLAASFFWAYALGFACGQDRFERLVRAGDKLRLRIACAVGFVVLPTVLAAPWMSRFLDLHVADFFEVPGCKVTALPSPIHRMNPTAHLASLRIPLLARGKTKD